MPGIVAREKEAVRRPFVWRRLLEQTSRRTKRHVFAAAALGLVGRLGVVATAMQVAHADARGAAIAGGFASAAFVLQRVTTASLRVLAECDLHRAAARALLDADVLEVAGEDVQRVVFEANHTGRNVIAGTLPGLLADVVASIVLAPVLASLFPVRVLSLATIGLLAVLGSLLVLRRATMRMQARVLAWAERVADGMSVAVEGRLELVARGGEPAFLASYDEVLAKYASIATRASLGSALLGRMPLVVGAAAVAVVVAVDGASRDALATTILGEALLLAAAMPALFGVVFGVHELVRSAPLVAPFVAILEAPARAELSRVGGIAPTVPAPVSFEHVSFAYDTDDKAALAGVDAMFQVGKPLVVVGPNGGGKSTLLRLLLGLRPPTTGAVRLGSVDLTKLDLRRFRREVAYLPQRPYLGEAYNTVGSAMRLGRPAASDEAIARCLERGGVLAALRKRKADPLAVKLGELSAGQRQRVALARILLQDAPMVLLDEPDANLDREGVRLVAELVSELVAAGKMVAIAAHAPELLEVSSSRIAVGNAERQSND